MPRRESTFLQRGLLAAAFLLLSAGLALAAPAGTVVGLLGECFVDSGGARSALKLGQPVQIGDTVDVPAGGKLKLRMGDGSIISLASGTRMQISAYGVDAAGQREAARLSLGQGLLRAVVAPVARPASFEVDTAVGTAAVRSTDWFVEAFPDAMQVGVLTGSVTLKSTTGRSEVIPERWGARLYASVSPEVQPSYTPPLRGAPDKRVGGASRGLDPVPPRVWSQAEFNAVIARTDVP